MLKNSSHDFPVLALAYEWVRGYSTRKVVSLCVFNQNMQHLYLRHFSLNSFQSIKKERFGNVHVRFMVFEEICTRVRPIHQALNPQRIFLWHGIYRPKYLTFRPEELVLKRIQFQTRIFSFPLFSSFKTSDNRPKSR